MRIIVKNPSEVGTMMSMVLTIAAVAMTAIVVAPAAAAMIAVVVVVVVAKNPTRHPFPDRMRKSKINLQRIKYWWRWGATSRMTTLTPWWKTLRLIALSTLRAAWTNCFGNNPHSPRVRENSPYNDIIKASSIQYFDRRIWISIILCLNIKILNIFEFKGIFNLKCFCKCHFNGWVLLLRNGFKVLIVLLILNYI